MPSLQSTGIDGTEFDAPKSDRFVADSDAMFSEEIFYIAVAEIESIVEPVGIGNDIRRKSMTFVCIHEPILSKPALYLGSTFASACRAR